MTAPIDCLSGPENADFGTLPFRREQKLKNIKPKERKTTQYRCCKICLFFLFFKSNSKRTIPRVSGYQRYAVSAIIMRFLNIKIR